MGLSMIVRNGAHMLYRILDVIRPPTEYWSGDSKHFDQVVIVDTGSTDGTVQLLKEKYPWVEVHEMEWQFDFSIARNHALSFMKTDMWMWLDADDTFTKPTLDRWFEIAQEMWNTREEEGHPVYALIPYIYKVDENDFPVVVHFRERILLGGAENWEWREPLHEVCAYRHPNGGHLAFNDCPVVHRPEATAENDDAVSNNRNWKIMMRHYLDGDRGDRTLYYIGRMANVEKQYELAIQVAQELADRNTGGYYEYEALVACGEAYAELYKRDNIDDYKTRAIDYLTRAKRFEPTRNDARSKLCDLYIHCKNTEEALAEANAMNEAMPATVATTLTAQYGKYKYSVLAMIQFRLVGNLWNTLVNHMKALDCPKPHFSSISLDESIRSYLRDQEIGIIYCDEKYNGHAMALRDILKKQMRFRDVLVFNDPHCLGYAEKFYFHFTEKEDTLYQEDGHPRLRKFLFSPYAEEWGTPFGYENAYTIPSSPSHLEEMVDELLNECPCVSVASMQMGLDAAMQSRTPKMVLDFTHDGDNCAALTELEFNNPTVFGRLRFVVNGVGELLGVTGWTDSIATLYVDRKEITRVADINAIEIVPAATLDGFDAKTPGIRWRIEQAPDSGKKLVIMAPGIEDWDGTTPRRWGIGASESCVVYMAEEMRKRGHKVVVYGTIARTCIVAGVEYMHIGQYYIDNPLPDLFVSSRVPEWMVGRRGKTQVLWMHDIPESYYPRLNDQLIIDRFITISDWQAKRCAKFNFKQSKFRFIPNGLVRWPEYNVERVAGRSIWVSQPERGVDNIHRMWQERPELFKDFWVVYGFYNLLNYAKGNIGRTEQSFLDTIRFKFALRQIGAKVVGRIPHWQVQKLAQTCERWLYPSVFPETFCVAGLEALHNGVQCYYSYNGATAETLDRAVVSEPEVPRRVKLGSPIVVSLDTSNDQPFVYERDSKNWLDAVDKHAGLNSKIGLDDPFYYWDRVGDEWESLLNHGI